MTEQRESLEQRGPTAQTGLHRVVRMTFRTEAVPEFLEIFADVVADIRRQPGCLHVELMRDAQWPDVYATFSVWKSEAALEAYRQTPFFRKTWSLTKALFAAPPRAESYGPVSTTQEPASKRNR
ncbi:MAG: putative quinol monooxygenase [Rhodothermales bacterium]